MRITSSEQLVVNDYYWIIDKDTHEETIGQWRPGMYFMVIGSDEYYYFHYGLEIWNVCKAKDILGDKDGTLHS